MPGKPGPSQPGPGPLPPSGRLPALDILRGVAVLGLLPINVQVFAMVSTATANPPTGGALVGTDGVAWIIVHLFMELKFETLVAVVFGASLVLLTQRLGRYARRAEEATSDVEDIADPTMPRRPSTGSGLHLKRLAALAVIGILAYVALWPRAELVALAAAGAAASSFVGWHAGALVRMGVMSIAFGSVLLLAYGFYLASLPPEFYEQAVAAYWLATPEAKAAELAHLKGWWFDQIAWRLDHAGDAHQFLFFMQTFWRHFGLMLIGMALLKWDVLTARLPSSRYAMGTLIGVLMGVPIVTTGILDNVSHHWDFAHTTGIGAQFNYWGSLLMAGGYGSFFLLSCKYDVLSRLKRSLAAVGRMSLSNYIVQLVVCGWIFYGSGLGLIGETGRLTQLGLAAALAFLQLAYSPFWLRAFRFGPVEWLWRTVYYGHSIELLHFATAARSRP